MSANTGALRATTGISARVAMGIAAAMIAAIVAVVLWTSFTGAEAEPATGSAVTTESVGSVPRTPDRPGSQDPGSRPNADHVRVGGEGQARYHPLP